MMMRGLIGALLLVPALAAKSEKFSNSVVKATDQAIAHITVSVPDELHESWDKKALGFQLQVLTSDAVCGFGNVTLNNQILPQTLVNGVSSGKGQLTTEHQYLVIASWAFHCVNVNGVEDAQLMKFIIEVADGQTVKNAGFSVLFRQSGLKEILSIETDMSIPDEILANPDPMELEPLHSVKTRPEYNIEDDLAELDYLWAQMHELKHLIHEKERVIAYHTHEHFEEMEEELAECDSLKCIAQTIAKEAKNAAHRLYEKLSGDEEFGTHGTRPFDKPHFKTPPFPKLPPHHGHKKNGTRFPKHPKGNHTHFPHKPLPICKYPPPPPRHGKRPPPQGSHGHGPDFDRRPHREGPPNHISPPGFDGPHHGPHDDEPPRKHHGHGKPSDFSGLSPHDDEESPDFDTSFEKHHDQEPHHSQEDRPHGGPPGFDGPPQKHDGPHDGPPDFDGPPPHGPSQADPPPHGPPPHGNPHDAPPPKDHGGPPGPPGPHHGPPGFAVQVVKYTAIGFLIACLLFALRRRACTPKRRASRQARREERHRRRAYRRAAHKHIITRILSRISGEGSDDEYDDYEEKREALLASAEDGMSTTMTEEITQLRTAAEVVGEMVVAEEERAITPPAEPIAIPASIPAPAAMSQLGDFEMAMLAQLGGEQLPAYEDNDGSEEGSFIADGFRYTPGSSNYSPSHSPAGSVSDILGPDTKS